MTNIELFTDDIDKIMTFSSLSAGMTAISFLGWRFVMQIYAGNQTSDLDDELDVETKDEKEFDIENLHQDPKKNNRSENENKRFQFSVCVHFFI
jgi:hypothetical protein